MPLKRGIYRKYGINFMGEIICRRPQNVFLFSCISSPDINKLLCQRGISQCHSCCGTTQKYSGFAVEQRPTPVLPVHLEARL